ncbi:MAG: hypothetical protein EA397_11605 [Deltaproteobacteria bacterium]|nr:MAG: hypothetical protein EA397_11605 [Deltaproteobacteria bacterium]
MLDSSALLTTPLPYHRQMVAYLRERLPSAWAHFASDVSDARYEEAQRLHLLQTTVALTRTSEPELYALADQVANKLGITVPVELYQGEDGPTMNAALYYSPRAARVVLEGAIQERLSTELLRAVLGHELAHHLMFSLDKGDPLHAFRLLASLVEHEATPTLIESLRLFQLHVEVYADRGALLVAGLEPTIEALVRVRTGLSKANPSDFLDQSRELLRKQGTGSRAWSHPEAHIRALALDHVATAESLDEAWVQGIIDGPVALEELDLLRRDALDQLTRRIIAWLISPAWFSTDAVKAHAELFYDDAPTPSPTPLTADDLESWGETVRDYLAAVLLDFVAVDPSIEPMPLLRADAVAEALGLQDRFQRAVNRHLRMTKRAIAEALQDRDAQLAQADVAVEDEHGSDDDD